MAKRGPSVRLGEALEDDLAARGSVSSTGRAYILLHKASRGHDMRPFIDDISRLLLERIPEDARSELADVLDGLGSTHRTTRSTRTTASTPLVRGSVPEILTFPQREHRQEQSAEQAPPAPRIKDMGFDV